MKKPDKKERVESIGKILASDVLVLFGVTGDLAHKVISGALSDVEHGTLNVQVIGVSSSKWTFDYLRLAQPHVGGYRMTAPNDVVFLLNEGY